MTKIYRRTNRNAGEWYAIFYAGWGDQPARGPFRSLADAEAAWRRWYDRQPQRTHDNAGSRADAGDARITGPYRTRREARLPDVNDPIARILA